MEAPGQQKYLTIIFIEKLEPKNKILCPNITKLAAVFFFNNARKLKEKDNILFHSQITIVTQ